MAVTQIPALFSALKIFLRKPYAKPFAEVQRMANEHSPEAVVSAIGYLLKSLKGSGGYRSALSNFDPLSAKRQPAVLFAGLMKKVAEYPEHLGVVRELNVEALCDWCFYNAAVNGRAHVMFAYLDDGGIRIAIQHRDRECIYIDFVEDDPELHQALLVSDISKRYEQYGKIEVKTPFAHRFLYQTLHAYGKGQSGRLTRLNKEVRKCSTLASVSDRASAWSESGVDAHLAQMLAEVGGDREKVLEEICSFLSRVLPQPYKALLLGYDFTSKTRMHLLLDILYSVVEDVYVSEKNEVLSAVPEDLGVLGILRFAVLTAVGSAYKLRAGYAKDASGNVRVAVWSGDKSVGVSFFDMPELHQALVDAEEAVFHPYVQHPEDVWGYPENFRGRRLKVVESYLYHLANNFRPTNPKQALLASMSGPFKMHINTYVRGLKMEAAEVSA